MMLRRVHCVMPRLPAVAASGLVSHNFSSLTHPEAVPDYYAVLNIPRNAPLDAVKGAFREQAKMHHPDVRKEDADIDQFKLINEAYTILSDPELRREYDLKGDTKYNRLLALRRKNEGIVDATDSVPLENLTEEERFRRSMAKATARHRDSAKFRATLARLNRSKIDLPSQTETYAQFAYPVAVLSLWAAIYFAFVK